VNWCKFSSKGPDFPHVIVGDNEEGYCCVNAKNLFCDLSYKQTVIAKHA